MKDIQLRTLSGQPTSLAQYEGKALLIVNVASECGFTPQYAGLEELYQRFKGQGLVVLGFPANDFGAQEPGSATQIGEFCASRGVTFPIFEKISVLGDTAHPLFQALVKAHPETTGDSEEFRQGIGGFLASKNEAVKSRKPEIFWNFEKFVLGRDGEVVARFSSTVEPGDPRVVRAIESALAR